MGLEDVIGSLPKLSVSKGDDTKPNLSEPLDRSIRAIHNPSKFERDADGFSQRMKPGEYPVPLNELVPKYRPAGSLKHGAVLPELVRKLDDRTRLEFAYRDLRYQRVLGLYLRQNVARAYRVGRANRKVDSVIARLERETDATFQEAVSKLSAVIANDLNWISTFYEVDADVAPAAKFDYLKDTSVWNLPPPAPIKVKPDLTLDEYVSELSPNTRGAAERAEKPSTAADLEKMYRQKVQQAVEQNRKVSTAFRDLLVRYRIAASELKSDVLAESSWKIRTLINKRERAVLCVFNPSERSFLDERVLDRIKDRLETVVNPRQSNGVRVVDGAGNEKREETEDTYRMRPTAANGPAIKCKGYERDFPALASLQAGDPATETAMKLLAGGAFGSVSGIDQKLAVVEFVVDANIEEIYGKPSGLALVQVIKTKLFDRLKNALGVFPYISFAKPGSVRFQFAFPEDVNDKLTPAMISKITDEARPEFGAFMKQGLVKEDAVLNAVKCEVKDVKTLLAETYDGVDGTSDAFRELVETVSTAGPTRRSRRLQQLVSDKDSSFVQRAENDPSRLKGYIPVPPELQTKKQDSCEIPSDPIKACESLGSIRAPYQAEVSGKLVNCCKEWKDISLSAATAERVALVLSLNTYRKMGYEALADMYDSITENTYEIYLRLKSFAPENGSRGVSETTFGAIATAVKSFLETARDMQHDIESCVADQLQEGCLNLHELANDMLLLYELHVRRYNELVGMLEDVAKNRMYWRETSQKDDTWSEAFTKYAKNFWSGYKERTRRIIGWAWSNKTKAVNALVKWGNYAQIGWHVGAEVFRNVMMLRGFPAGLGILGMRLLMGVVSACFRKLVVANPFIRAWTMKKLVQLLRYLARKLLGLFLGIGPISLVISFMQEAVSRVLGKIVGSVGIRPDGSFIANGITFNVSQFTREEIKAFAESMTSKSLSVTVSKLVRKLPGYMAASDATHRFVSDGRVRAVMEATAEVGSAMKEAASTVGSAAAAVPSMARTAYSKGKSAIWVLLSWYYGDMLANMVAGTAFGSEVLVNLAQWGDWGLEAATSTAGAVSTGFQTGSSFMADQYFDVAMSSANPGIEAAIQQVTNVFHSVQVQIASAGNVFTAMMDQSIWLAIGLDPMVLGCLLGAFVSTTTIATYASKRDVTDGTRHLSELFGDAGTTALFHRAKQRLVQQTLPEDVRQYPLKARHDFVPLR
jgi:hypothetical protein